MNIKLSYDGFGLNLVSQKYAPRIATFERGISQVEEKEWDKIGPLLAASPDLYACIYSFLSNWPQLGVEDEEVNGADLVDWLNEQVPYWRVALAKAEGKLK